MMPYIVPSVMQLAGLALGVAGLAYLILALRSTIRHRERAVAPVNRTVPVSVMKPVYGTSPTLYECLRSFCDQEWPTYEVIFGAHSADDPAIAVVNRLIAEFPRLDIRLVVDGHLAGPNRKAANLANMAKHAQYPLLIVADADVVVDRNCIASMAAEFEKATVGAVATIYKGRPVDTAAARFGALFLNDWFVPSVLVDVDLRGIDFVFGALSAIRREALDAIGGFEHLAQCLAEDFSMGRLVAERGWRVVLSPYACETIVSETSYADVIRHEERWQRSERACRPFDQFMSVVTWPLPVLLLLLLPQPSIVGLGVVGLHLILRIALHAQIRRSFQISDGASVWLLPLRECACFLAWFRGLFGNSVQWGQETFSIQRYRELMAASARQIGSPVGVSMPAKDIDGAK